ncbi:MAG: hypothetical protein M5U28_35510 [Sandaracinaceae bacterium]|nr:hypothetical protein [Sandaracinaceae bacterium]
MGVDRRALAMGLGWCAVAVACDAPLVASPDGATDAQSARLPLEPSPPLPPEPVQIDGCPPGWRARAIDERTTVCEPWEGERAPDCAPDELAIPGVGCERVDECPPDGWPRDLPTVGVVHVRAGEIGGDGSRERPFGTLAEGLAAARGRDVILALAAGEYEGGSALGMYNRELRGACASGTVIHDPETGLDQAALTVYVTGARMSGVRIVGGTRALWLAGDASVEATNLVLEGSFGGLRLDPGASFDGDRVRVSGGREGAAGLSIHLRPRSRLLLRRSTILGGVHAAIGAYANASDPPRLEIAVTLEDSAVLDAREAVSGFVSDVIIRRSVLERLAGGVYVGPGGSAELTDVRARDVQPLPGGFDAAVFGTAGQGTAARLWVSDAAQPALSAGGAGARLVAADLVVEGYPGGATVLAAKDEGTLEVSRAVLRDSAASAIEATDDGAVVVTDLDVVDTVGGAMPDPLVWGRAGTVTLSRARARSLGRTFAVAAAGARIDASDVDVEGGSGLIAECAPEVDLGCDPGAESHLALARARLRGVRRFGVAFERARGSVRDLLVEGWRAAVRTAAASVCTSEGSSRRSASTSVAARATRSFS